MKRAVTFIALLGFLVLQLGCQETHARGPEQTLLAAKQPVTAQPVAAQNTPVAAENPALPATKTDTQTDAKTEKADSRRRMHDLDKTRSKLKLSGLVVVVISGDGDREPVDRYLGWSVRTSRPILGQDCPHGISGGRPLAASSHRMARNNGHLMIERRDPGPTRGPNTRSQTAGESGLAHAASVAERAGSGIPSSMGIRSSPARLFRRAEEFNLAEQAGRGERNRPVWQGSGH